MLWTIKFLDGQEGCGLGLGAKGNKAQRIWLSHSQSFPLTQQLAETLTIALTIMKYMFSPVPLNNSLRTFD